MILVHSLGSSSLGTWGTPTGELWPKTWLAQEKVLKGMRIHSFDYVVDPRRGTACLDIKQYGAGLLERISESPGLSASDTPIILMAHSLGGQVVKAAYMLARQGQQHRQLGKRIRSMMFLATAHRTPDPNKTLKTILSVTSPLRFKSQDIERCAESVQSINTAFRDYTPQLHLFSFYEVVCTPKVGGLKSKKIIVGPDDAIMGHMYPGEEQIPMHADHRSICRPGSREGLEYRMYCNALDFAIEGLSK